MGLIDLAGQKIGRLQVISRVERRWPGDRAVRWLCKCDCGKEVIKYSAAIRNSKLASCGCIKSNIIDLAGQEIGRLTVIKRVENNTRKRVQWLCKCSCGNLVKVTSSSLRKKKGGARSCGCLRKERTNFLDLAGREFGRLTVIEEMTQRTRGSVCWKCKCTCGNEKVIASKYLMNGDVRSCGCLQEELNKQPKYDLVGFESGRLTAVHYVHGTGHWLCKCSCGKDTLVQTNHLRMQLRKSCGCLKQMETHSRWKGGYKHTKDGYVLVKTRETANHPRVDSHGYVKEHTLVLEEELDRYLEKDEFAHHRNNIPWDNRPENLELVIKETHFKGSRVSDLVEFAKWVLNRYDPEVLAEECREDVGGELKWLAAD